MSDEFISQMMPHALRVSQQTGIDPRIVIAQSALETGWGQSAPGNNYFGIKSHGRSGGNQLNTQEYRNGAMRTEPAVFRGYRDMGESADDYGSFLQTNPRYRAMLSAGSFDDQVRELGRSGYATDPEYENKIRQIASQIEMPNDSPIQTFALNGDGSRGRMISSGIDPRNIRINDEAPQDRSGVLSSMNSPDVGALGSTQSTGGGSNPSAAAVDDSGWLNRDRSQMLLAIGSGLLSGDDWATGIGAAGENLMAVRADQLGRQDILDQEQRQYQQQIETDQRRANIDRESMRYGSELRQAELENSPRNYEMVGNVQMSDGSIRGDLRFDGQNYVDPQGQPVTDQVGQRVNNSDAFGSRGQISGSDAQTISVDLVTQGNLLGSMDKVLTELDSVEYGISGFITDLQKNIDTLTGQGITPEALQRAYVGGTLQSLLGGLRESVVGPGVMTEADAARIIAAMGGDLSLMSNPEAMKARLTTVFQNELSRYEQKYTGYQGLRSAYPNNNYPDVPRFTTQRQTVEDPIRPQGNQTAPALSGADDTEAILQRLGI